MLPTLQKTLFGYNMYNMITPGEFFIFRESLIFMIMIYQMIHGDIASEHRWYREDVSSYEGGAFFMRGATRLVIASAARQSLLN